MVLSLPHQMNFSIRFESFSDSIFGLINFSQKKLFEVENELFFEKKLFLGMKLVILNPSNDAFNERNNGCARHLNVVLLSSCPFSISLSLSSISHNLFSLSLYLFFFFSLVLSLFKLSYFLCV